MPYRFVGEYATHAMFAHHMFPKDLKTRDVEARRWTMLNVPSFTCVPERDGCRAEAAVIIDTKNRICLVAGRADYCGVVKKTIFTVGNFLLPKEGRLSMHCSANVGARGDAAILFDPDRLDEMMEAIATGLSDEARRNELAEKGRARARSFTWEAAADKVRAIHRSL